ncbi:nSTAND3 domain-containing NTPase [Saccharopolyspora sp. NPDC003752]
MTETNNEFHDTQGSPIHAGSGDLNVNPIYYTIHESVQQQARGPRLTLKDDLLWLKRRFEPPQNLGAARDMLRQSRTVVLTGPPGSGRRTAAKMLLNELADDHTPFTVLDDEARTQDPSLDKLKVQPGHLFVLDLSESGEDVFHARQRDLLSFRTILQQRNGFLAVVVPDSRKHHLDADLRQFEARIGRPRGSLVLQRHLQPEGIVLTDQLLASKELARSLSAPMSEIANLAQMVVLARDANLSGDVSTWLGEAVSARIDRSNEVAEQLSKVPGGRRRTVLLAAAMCRGASSDAVFFASHRLVSALSLDGREEPRMEQEGYRTQLVDLSIDVAPNNRIEFSLLSYDRAVREHFWDNYPDLREPFCRWVDDIIRIEQFTTQDRMNLVDRFAEQALRTNCPGHVRWLIDRWVFPRQNGAPNALRDYGVRALLTGLRSERHGHFFRRLVYEWSRRNDLPGDVGQIVVDVCTAMIAPTYPEQALVRLHHRARNEDGTGAPTAYQALVELTSRDPMLLRLLLDRLTTGLAKQQPWPADHFLFLAVADPVRLADSSTRSQPLAADHTIRSQLGFCWRATMLARPDLVVQRVCHWLDAAGRTAPHDLLLGILVDAASQHLHLLGSLHVLARDWSRTTSGRADVFVRLSQLIDMAQGLHSTDYTFDHVPEEAVR